MPSLSAVIRVVALTEPRPPADNTGTWERDPASLTEVDAVGDTYELARDAIIAALPEDRRVVWLRTAS